MTATQLQGCDVTKVQVLGLADARTGTAAVNQSLSERRARSVAEALVSAGLPAPAFEVAAAGAAGAVVNGVNDPLRRRTEVLIEAKPRR
ncbi:Outer membrane protein A precursor [compost metagenome]